MLLMTGLASRRPHEKPARRNDNEFRTFRAIPGQSESGRRRDGDRGSRRIVRRRNDGFGNRRHARRDNHRRDRHRSGWDLCRFPGCGFWVSRLPCSRHLAELDGKREREGCCGGGSDGGGRLRQLVNRFSFEYGWWRLARSATCGKRLSVAVTGMKCIAHYQIGDVAGTKQTQSNPEEPAPHALLARRRARFIRYLRVWWSLLGRGGRQACQGNLRRFGGEDRFSIVVLSEIAGGHCQAIVALLLRVCNRRFFRLPPLSYLATGWSAGTRLCAFPLAFGVHALHRGASTTGHKSWSMPRLFRGAGHSRALYRSKPPQQRRTRSLSPYGSDPFGATLRQLGGVARTARRVGAMRHMPGKTHFAAKAPGGGSGILAGEELGCPPQR